MHTQDVGQALERAASDEMSISVVHALQSIQIEQQDREFAAGAAGALDFGFENVNEMPVIGEARKRIADSQVPYLQKQPRVIEQGSAKHEGIAGCAQELRQRKGCVQHLC